MARIVVRPRASCVTGVNRVPSHAFQPWSCVPIRSEPPARARIAVITLLAGPDGDRDSFADLEGLGRRSPVLAVAMSIFMLSLAGFPPSVGFFGKLFLFTAGVGAGYTWLVVLAVLMSVVSVFYYVRVLIPIWSPSTRLDRVPASISSTATVVLSGVASVALGLYPTGLLLAGQLGANQINPP